MQFCLFVIYDTKVYRDMHSQLNRRLKMIGLKILLGIREPFFLVELIAMKRLPMTVMIMIVLQLRMISQSLLQQKVTGHGLMDLIKVYSFGKVEKLEVCKMVCLKTGVLSQPQIDNRTTQMVRISYKCG